MWEFALNILRDPLWQFIGALLILGSLIVSLFLLKQRGRKSLTYEILSNISLLSNKEEIKGKLKILFEETPVEDVHLIEIKIINSGNTPIISTDYEQSINLTFNKESKILTTEISETTPRDLPVTATISDGKIIINRILLNNGDAFIIKMLISQFDGNIFVNGRISGVKEIKKLGNNLVLSLGLAFGGFIITIVGLIIFYQNTPHQSATSEQLSIAATWGIILFFIGYITSFTGMFMLKRFRKFLLSLLSRKT
jgi:hypothetical protein